MIIQAPFLLLFRRGLSFLGLLIGQLSSLGISLGCFLDHEFDHIVRRGQIFAFLVGCEPETGFKLLADSEFRVQFQSLTTLLVLDRGVPTLANLAIFSG